MWTKHLLCDLALLQGAYPKEIKELDLPVAICAWLVMVALFTVAKGNLGKARCPFIDEYILETIMYLMEYYSPFKKKVELLKHMLG